MEPTEQYKHKKKERIVFGLLLLSAGILLLLGQFGFNYPAWIFTWPMILITIGIAKALKHGFRNLSWLIILAVGGLFLAEKIDPSLNIRQFTWPVLLIAVGIFIIFGKTPKRCERNRNKWRRKHGFRRPEFAERMGFSESSTEKKNEKAAFVKESDDEIIDSVTFLGGTKKSIFSKNFKGGDVFTFMGGTELNFSHADIKDIAVLDVVQVFGGTKIIIPPDWEVTAEMAAVFGGIDDKRVFQPQGQTGGKKLIIKGTSVFGGIDIKSF